MSWKAPYSNPSSDLVTPLPPHEGLWASVVLINYNGSRYIDPCIGSLLRSDYPWFDVIVVDNASTDDSLARLQVYGNRLRLVRNARNELSSGGLNRGIRLARGEIVVLLDMDTEVRPDWLRQLLVPLALDPGVAVTGSKLLYGDGVTIQHAGGTWEDNAMCRHFGQGEKDHGQWDRRAEVDYVTGAAIAIRREFLEKVDGGLDELFPFYYEETDLCWHARRFGYRVVYVPQSVAIHHESATMVRNSPHYLFHYHRSRCRFILKNFPWRELLGRMLYREIRWLLRAGHTNQLWRILPLCYLSAMAAVPAVVQRRLARRRALASMFGPRMLGCLMTDSLFLKANGKIPCGCDGGKYHTLFTVDLEALAANHLDPAHHPAIQNLRSAFGRGELPFPRYCRNCVFSRQLFHTGVEAHRRNLKLLHIEPCARCTLRCPDCERFNDGPPLLTLPLLEEFLRSLRRSGIERIDHSIFEGFGEPLLNPHLPELIAAVKRAFPQTVTILSTSGNHPYTENLARAPLDHLKLSIDGTSRQTYERYRKGGSFEMACDFLNAAVLSRKDRGIPRHIQWKYILFEWNDSDEEIREAGRMARGLGVEILFVASCNPQNRTKRFDTANLQKRIHELVPEAGVVHDFFDGTA